MGDGIRGIVCDPPPGKLIPFNRIAKEIDWIPPKHVCQYHRWRDKGLGGHRLKALRIGGTWCTCEEWLIEFFAALSGTSVATADRGSTRRAARRVASAIRDLEREHIG